MILFVSSYHFPESPVRVVSSPYLSVASSSAHDQTKFDQGHHVTIGTQPPQGEPRTLSSGLRLTVAGS